MAEEIKNIEEVEVVQEDMNELFDEITDRYGDMPRSVLRLLRISLCRAYQARARIKKSTLISGRIFINPERHEIDRWAAVMERHPRQLIGVSSPHGSLMYLLTAKEEPTEALLSLLKDYVNTEDISEKEGK